jgi:hypothetical protein
MSRKRPRIDGFIRLLAGGRSSAREAVICGDCGIDLVASEYATLNEVDIAIGVSLSERARKCQHHLCMRCLAMAHADCGAELTIRCRWGCKSPSWIIHARWQRGQIREGSSHQLSIMSVVDIHIYSFGGSLLKPGSP